MTAQQQVLPPPVLPDASNGVLYVDNLKDPVRGDVPPYANATVGDRVELTVKTSTNNQWRGSFVLTESSLEKPVIFGILKETFAKGLIAGASATLYYTITHAFSNPIVSPPLTVYLKP
ncbi:MULTISPECIES: hypothetical protein [Pseudomonas]|uniref:Uncharacterized protein n=1 Tax=Pseudomonas lini TaxID=163011 RepID=A0A423IKF3_9PSED|nr:MULTISPECIES: hypothetical protein [Pseudomonas]RON25903.1 hypothetical protein BK663_16610 [Pseudomonas lini]